MNTIAAKRMHAFTLIELLAVIGVLSLLLGLLLPALIAARRNAQRTKCLSNLHQISLAFVSYANDCKGYWPMASCYFTPPGQNDAVLVNRTREKYWYHALSRYLTSDGSRLNEDGTDANAAGKIKDRDSVLWGCPAWNRYIVSGSITIYDRDTYTGYGMNVLPKSPDPLRRTGAYYPIAFRGGQLSDDIHANGWFQRWNAWRSPERRALVVDAWFHFVEISEPWPWWGQGPMPDIPDSSKFTIDFNRHGNKARGNAFNARTINTLFCDGHTGALSAKEAHYACTFSSSSAP